MKIGLRNTHARYGIVAMTLHWAIAAAILFMIWLGNTMSDLPLSDPNKFTLTQLHKSIGLTILVLSVLRLLWRLVNPVPALPASMPRWERLAARGTHYLFYVLIIVIPLLGWATVSASPLGLPTEWFGQFEWPHIPFLADLTRAQKHVVDPPLRAAHAFLAYTALGLIVLHIAAALKHQFWNRDTVLARMLPWTKVES